MNITLKFSLTYDDQTNIHRVFIHIYEHELYADYIVLTLDSNKFKCIYTTCDKFHEQLLKYLIKSNIIELYEEPYTVYKDKIYAIRLTQSKMLELI